MFVMKNQRPPPQASSLIKSARLVLLLCLSPFDDFSIRLIIVDVLFSVVSYTHHISFFLVTVGSNVNIMDQRVSNSVSGMTPGSGGIRT